MGMGEKVGDKEKIERRLRGMGGGLEMGQERMGMGIVGGEGEKRDTGERDREEWRVVDARN